MIRIGIGFGNARTRVYVSGSKCSDVLAFDGGALTPWIPTAVRSFGGEKPALCGYPALYGSGGELCTGLKSRIASPDPLEREKARELAAIFFRYIEKTFEAKRMFFGEGDEPLQAVIAGPGGWDEKTREFVLAALCEAGFGENILIKSSALAAFETLPHAKMAQIVQHFPGRDSLSILAVKLGHATLDCAFLRMDARTDAAEVTGGTSRYGAGFVGTAVDGWLKEYLLTRMAVAGLPQEEAGEIRGSVSLQESLRGWKEGTVLPALAQNRRVEECSFLMAYGPLMDRPLQFSFSRADFQQWAQGALRETLQEVTNLAESTAEPADLFLLYGGNSCWITEKVAALPGMSRMVVLPYGEEHQLAALRRLIEKGPPPSGPNAASAAGEPQDADAVVRSVCAACPGNREAGVYVIGKPQERIDLSSLAPAATAAKMGFQASRMPPVYAMIAFKDDGQSLNGMLLIARDGVYKWRKGLKEARVFAWDEVTAGTQMRLVRQGEHTAVFLSGVKLAECGGEQLMAVRALVDGCVSCIKKARAAE